MLFHVLLLHLPLSCCLKRQPFFFSMVTNCYYYSGFHILCGAKLIPQLKLTQKVQCFIRQIDFLLRLRIRWCFNRLWFRQYRGWHNCHHPLVRQHHPPKLLDQKRIERYRLRLFFFMKPIPYLPVSGLCHVQPDMKAFLILPHHAGIPLFPASLPLRRSFSARVSYPFAVALISSMKSTFVSPKFQKFLRIQIPPPIA